MNRDRGGKQVQTSEELRDIEKGQFGSSLRLRKTEKSAEKIIVDRGNLDHQYGKLIGD